MNENYNTLKLCEVLNEYLANLKVLNNNLYNMHFNVIGPNFFTIHKKLEEYYDKVAEMYDAVAERIKMLSCYPITSLVQYENVSTIKSMKSQDYTEKQVLGVLTNDFTFMLQLSKEVGEFAKMSNDDVSSGIIGDNASFFEKQLWMVKASNK